MERDIRALGTTISSKPDFVFPPRSLRYSEEKAKAASKGGGLLMSTAQTSASQEEIIQEITRRLVAFYQPVKIYLFGSVARGESGPDSDLDFCVVVPDETPPDRFRAGASHGALAGIKGC
jgi:UTP:GlnB (protein PII) uridylyltransferase